MKLHSYRKVVNLMIVIVMKKTAVKIQFKLMSRLRQLTLKMWIAQVTNTKTFLKGLKTNLS